MFNELITHEFLEFQLEALSKKQASDVKHETLIFLEDSKVSFIELFNNPTEEKMLELRKELFAHLDAVIKIPKRLRLLSVILLAKNEAQTIGLLSNYYRTVSSIATYELAIWFQKNREDIFLLEAIDE